MKMAQEKAERYEKSPSILERIAPRKAPHAPSVGKRGVMAKTKDWEAFREQLLKNGEHQLKDGVERLRGAIRAQGKENEAFRARIQGKTRELQGKTRELEGKTRTYARDFYHG